MVRSSGQIILYPTRQFVQDLHDLLIKERGDQGWMSKGMVEGCIEWVKTDVFNFIPFPGLLTKAGALMYAYINFHPFTDGNKRTALMTASFFFFINGYRFSIPNNAPEFTKDIATRTADTPDHEPSIEIGRISNWLKPSVNASRSMRLLYLVVKSTLPQNATEDMVFASPAWRAYFETWHTSTTERIHRLRK